MCTDKRRYDSRSAAMFFARTDGLRPYKCPHCPGWHLTSKVQDHRKRVRAS